MPRPAFLLLLLASSSFSLAAPAPQKKAARTPAEKLMAARGRYYTPTASGLRGFHCGVDFNWPKLFASYGSPLPEDSPVLHYFRSVRLSISDKLKGEGQLEWSDTGTPPDELVKAAAQMRDGLKETVAGFLTSWNGFVNGNMVPVPDDATTIVATPDGYRLHTASSEFDVTEEYDSDFLLKQAHVITSDMDVVSSPTFDQTPDGLRVSTVLSVVRQPKTAAPALATMSATYAPVSGFQIPSSIHVDVKNVGRFDFPLSNCTVDAEKQ